MAGSTWNVFSPNTRAYASKVNENFDWLEGSLIPMNAGVATTGAYDLGSGSAKWRNIYSSGNIYGGTTPNMYYLGDSFSLFLNNNTANSTQSLHIHTSGAMSVYKQSSARFGLTTNFTIPTSNLDQFTTSTIIPFSDVTQNVLSEGTTSGYFVSINGGAYLVSFGLNTYVGSNTSSVVKVAISCGNNYEYISYQNTAEISSITFYCIKGSSIIFAQAGSTIACHAYMYTGSTDNKVLYGGGKTFSHMEILKLK